MEASEFTTSIQQQFAYEYSSTFQTSFDTDQPRPVTKPVLSSEQSSRTLGSLNLYVKGKLYKAAPNTQEDVFEDRNPSLTLSRQILSALDSLFSYTASISIPPTKCARLHYLFAFTIASAYSWVTSSGPLTGVKDGWNFNQHYPLPPNEVYVWMTHMLDTVMRTFLPTYDSSSLLSIERTKFGLTPAQQMAHVQRVQRVGNFTLWLNTWENWIAIRNKDGSVQASVPPHPSQLPNGSLFLEVTEPQDFTTYPDPTLWTPLSINGAPKRYLTYDWGSVRSTCLTEQEEAHIKAKASLAFPSPSQREDEIASLLNLPLTDTQKVIAEFWAGGPSTISPPGMCIWFWRTYVSLTGQSDSTVVYSGLDLAIHLFEASRLTWALKKQFMEARPLQEIRARYAETLIPFYDGSMRLGKFWVPYQMPTFVTPPFPDFPSGHSTFSQTFANVMNDWFSSAIPSQPFIVTNLSRISPLFPTTPYTIRLDEIPIPALSSQIQPGVVPSTPLTLTWTTWQEMADSAGVSRQYGGIHAQSAHVGGQSVANELYPLLKAAWGLRAV